MKQVIKKSISVLVTLVMTYLVFSCLECVGMWYLPLGYVDNLNAQEDYFLWWFCLYVAALLLPLWFFSIRKTIRLFWNRPRWLSLSALVPKKITALTTLASLGLIFWQIKECGDCLDASKIADVPEYGQAAAVGHLFQALMWGVVLFYGICLLVKQVYLWRKAKRETECLESL